MSIHSLSPFEGAVVSPIRGGTLYALVNVIEAHEYMPLCTVCKIV